MFTNTACQIRLKSLPESRNFPTTKERFTSCEMNTDINFLFVKYIPKCNWADLMARLQLPKDNFSLRSDSVMCRFQTLPGRAIVWMAQWLQLDYHEYCTNFQVNLVGKAFKKCATFVGFATCQIRQYA